MIRSIIQAGAILFILTFCFGCRKNPPALKQEAPQVKNQPGWVTRCGPALADFKSEKFYGCGKALKLADKPLLMQSADECARTDLAKNIDSYVSSLFMDFLGNSSVREKTELDEIERQQFILSLTRQITETTLLGTQIFDRWSGPDGTVHSIAAVRFEDLAGIMSKVMRERAKEIRLEESQAVQLLDQLLEKRRAAGQ